MLMSYDVPILLIAWRRPNELSQLITILRNLKPTQVFVACDGASEHRIGDENKVRKTREVARSEIDWSCHRSFKFSDKNLGCKVAVNTAIDWFFEHVDSGIVLEDDCMPNLSFFEYCRVLLTKYRDDQRVWCIGGVNFQEGRPRAQGSYYFSVYNHCWGWATWKSRWVKNDPDIQSWPLFKQSGFMSSIFPNQQECRYWTNIFDTLYKFGVPDTWDYQWMFTCLINGGLTALPNNNLVQNVGFSDDATHTCLATSSVEKATQSMNHIMHPHFILADKIADSYTFKNVFRISLIGKFKAAASKAINFLTQF